MSYIDEAGVAPMQSIRGVYPHMPVVQIPGFPDRLMRLPVRDQRIPPLFAKPFQRHLFLEAVTDVSQPDQAPR